MIAKSLNRSVLALLLLTGACAVTPARRMDVAPTLGPQRIGIHVQVRADTGAPPSGDQIVVGWMGSVLGGFLAWRLFDEPNGQHSRVKNDWGYTPRALTALAIGSYAGSTLGVWGRGKINGSRGSVLVTGVLATPPTIAILAMNDDPLLMLKLVVAWAPLQSYMAYTGYRVSTRSPIGGEPGEVIVRGEETRPRSSSNLIAAEELRKTAYTNVYDAIRQLRPHWAATAHLRSPTEREGAGEAGVIVVYLDGARFGAMDGLRQIALADVAEVQYFEAREATIRFGTGHPAGAINVRRAGRQP